MTFEPSPLLFRPANHVQTKGLDRDRLHAFSSACHFFSCFAQHSRRHFVDSFVSVCGRRARWCLSGCHFTHFASEAPSAALFSVWRLSFCLVLLTCSLFVICLVCQSALSTHSGQHGSLFSGICLYFPFSALQEPIHLPNAPWSQHLADETCPLSLQPLETSVPMTDGFITVADCASNP